MRASASSLGFWLGFPSVTEIDFHPRYRHKVYGYSKRPPLKRADAVFTAERFANSLNKPSLRETTIRARVITFLNSCERSGHLEEGKLFINNLIKLQGHRNKDQTRISGVTKIFEKAEDLIKRRKEDYLCGVFFEPVAALFLIKEGFKIKEVSASTYLKDGIAQEFIGSDGIEREFDIIAEKKYPGGILTFFIDAKNSTNAVVDGEKHNGQTTAQIEIAMEHGAIPTIILNTVDVKPLVNGSSALYTDAPVFKVGKLAKHIAKYPNLLIWDIHGKPILDESFIQDEIDGKNSGMQYLPIYPTPTASQVVI